MRISRSAAPRGWTRRVLGDLRFDLVVGLLHSSHSSHSSHIASKETAQRPGAAPEKARNQHIIIRVVTEVENQTMGQLPRQGPPLSPRGLRITQLKYVAKPASEQYCGLPLSHRPDELDRYYSARQDLQ